MLLGVAAPEPPPAPPAGAAPSAAGAFAGLVVMSAVALVSSAEPDEHPMTEKETTTSARIARIFFMIRKFVGEE